jgi:hypothetical protein
VGAPHRAAHGDVARDLSQRGGHQRVLQEGGRCWRQRRRRSKLEHGRDADGRRRVAVRGVLRAAAPSLRMAVHRQVRVLHARGEAVRECGTAAKWA